jgi:hypothetical protein
MKPNIRKQESTIYVESYLTLVETVDLEGQDPFGTIECDRSTAKMKQEKLSLLHVR